jgi:hypothetical protein
MSARSAGTVRTKPADNSPSGPVPGDGDGVTIHPITVRYAVALHITQPG